MADSTDRSEMPIPLGYELPDLAKRRRIRTTTIVLLCVTGIAVTLLVLGLLPATNRVRTTQRLQMPCAFHLKNIGLACLIYANEHNGKYPDTFEEIMLAADMPPEQFICPGSGDTPAPGKTRAEQAAHLSEGRHLSYTYIGKGLTTSVVNRTNVVVAYEHPANYGGSKASHLLFADGHVEWINAIEWIDSLPCARNLGEIGSACKAYAVAHNGHFPDSLEEIMRTTDALTAEHFICPKTGDVPAPGKSAAEQAAHLSEGGHLSYVYAGKGLTSTIPPPYAVVLAYEPPANHHGGVGSGSEFLFADGHVEWKFAKDAAALIAAIPATQPTTAP
jgi:prepilin-type processing-associated H-X9-DG protein